MASSGMIRRVALVGFYKSHTGITSQKTPFFIVAAVKTSKSYIEI
jgi:hypothetical protein